MTEQKKSLSRQVAEAVGWSVKGIRNKYLLVDTNDVPVVPDETYIDDFPTEESAWAAAPDFEHDATACITALDATGDNWSNDSHVILGKRRHVLTLAGEYTGGYDDFCTAACKALIKWRMWKNLTP